MICFQISIFEPLETTNNNIRGIKIRLWFAFKLVSLNHWKQQVARGGILGSVVICFQISIFEPLETTSQEKRDLRFGLWFAFKLVSLNHWKQRKSGSKVCADVVICFQISIFEPLETTKFRNTILSLSLWFAFKLVSLNHWKQQNICYKLITN